MTTHISDELPRLLTGDATREVVLDAAAHLRTCADCQQELVSAVVAHASLMSAHRFAPEIVSPGSSSRDDEEDETPPPALPDMSAMFTQVRAEAVAPAARPRRLHAGLAVAAAAAVIVGGGAVAVTALNSGSNQPSTRNVSLAAFDKGTAAAKVTIVGSNRMKVDASSLPKLDSKHQYEVWLTDDTRHRMQSVGFINNNNTADLAVPSKLMSQYNDIEVSVQRTNEIAYSGTSVLRGTYG